MDRCKLNIRRFAAGFCLSALLFILPAFSLQARAEDGYDQTADSSAMGDVNEKLASYGMTPVTGDLIDDGTYVVGTECSSRFFRIEKAELTVQNGQMTALLTMSSSSYSFVYPGTAREAAEASADDYIPSVEIDTWDTFTVPVEALDTELDLAAFSRKKKKWYPRKILFHASDIPAENLHFSYPDYDRIEEAMALLEGGVSGEGTQETESAADSTPARKGQAAGGEDASVQEGLTPDAAGTAGDALQEAHPAGNGSGAVSVDKEDGTWSIEVTLAGGSGRASVTSPTWLFVQDGKAFARLLWSSSYYDYMVLDGVRYLNETTDGGNSTFTIPVTALDAPVNVIADTTAMGEPVEIAYTLTFYSDSIGSTGRIPQEAAKRVLAGAAAFIVLGGIVNYLIKRKQTA